MLAMEIQERLDAIVYDLQFAGKGKTVQLMFRDASNQPLILPLSSNPAGVVDAAQLTAVQTFVNGLKTAADTYNTDTAPYTAKAAELAAIRNSVAYQNARTVFANLNVTENYNELANAKGNYIS